MPLIQISGIHIAYELLGKERDPAVAITPGGRFSKDSKGVRELAAELASRGKRVLIWDRPNCGASDLAFDGPGESRLHAETLIGLIDALDLGKTALVGGSAGSRVSLMAAIYKPEAVSHLVVWWISGGFISLMMLGAYYCCGSAIAARNAGMEAVAQLPVWSEQLRRNPRNREILLNQDPEKFVATMERWAKSFIPAEGSPLPALTRADLNKLNMPVLIFRGSPTDLFHPAEASEWLHQRISHSELIALPWPDDIFARRMVEAERTGDGHFVDWPDLAPTILEFVSTKRAAA
jgi:pimeloyl-ACP methyl ester carboxylesterase